jgi:2-polyprenyl-3-methyl-5-hydroxy-6-metoxy-1,4-benzoquinol methylase
MVQSNNKIRTHSIKNCYICGSEGEPLYRDLRDRIFGVLGEWNFLKCPNLECGLVWLDQMPRFEDIGKLYANYYTHDSIKTESFLYRLLQRAKNGYLRVNHPAIKRKIYDLFLGFLLYLHPSHRFDVDIIVTQLPAPGKRLLDIGCGDGKSLMRFQELGWEAEGIDIDHIAVKTARAKGLDVRVGQISEQKYPEGYFDVVVMNHVIEHVLEPVTLLQECHRVLKSGGYLVAYSPNVRSLGHKLYKSNWRGLEPPRHLYLFSKGTLLCLARKASFTDAYCHIVPRAHRIWKASNMLQRRNKSSTIQEKRIAKPLIGIADYIEWLFQRFDEEAGEEILLIAVKF